MSGSASLRALVLAARRRWLVARWAESVLLGGAVAGVTLAAATWSGAPPGSTGAGLAAALCAVLAALTLAGARRRTPEAFALRLDERMGEGGALATAFECAGRAELGALAALHVARTAGRLDRRRLQAAVTPPSTAFLAALALGAALAALAVERGGRLAGPAGGPPAGAALGRIADLAALPAAAATGELDEALRAAAALEDPRDAPTRELQGARDALGSLLGREGLDATTERLARSLLERLGAPDAGRAGEPAAGSDRPALAGEPAGRTMSGLSEEDPVSSTPTTTAPAAAAPAGRWWPRRHDAVVAGYLERRRSEGGGGR